MVLLLTLLDSLHNRLRLSIRSQPSLSDHPKHQLRIEPFPGPRGHPFVIEVGGDLAAIQTFILKPQDAVNQRLMGRVKIDQGQRIGLDRQLNTKVC
jgi:hypothetical protein